MFSLFVLSSFLYVYSFLFSNELARRLRAKFWPDCANPDTSMKFGTVVDHD